MDIQICKGEKKGDGATIILDLPSRDGTYTTVTQYNNGTTSISINNRTVEEIDQIIKGFQDLKKTMEKFDNKC